VLTWFHRARRDVLSYIHGMTRRARCAACSAPVPQIDRTRSASIAFRFWRFTERAFACAISRPSTGPRLLT
jgi:hypothetical protein